MQDLQENQAAENEGQVEIAGVRFKEGGKIYYFDPQGIKYELNNFVIVETVRGVEFGSIAIENKFLSASELVSALKPILRKATAADETKNIQNKAVEENARNVWSGFLKKNKMEMQLIDVEYTFDNTKLIFYFTAEGRVDFRDLVKDLASVFKTRIELRQIGVRDEARLIGGMGVCGRPFCCRTFLSDFTQVSIKMAKDQNLPLSSSKISGTCGRLMCCLRYEQDTYEREYATFPKPDSIVETPEGRGIITESNFLTNKIKVKMYGDNNNSIKTFAKKEIKIIGQAKSNENIDPSLLELEE